jgi:hypothetical protein
MQYHSPRTYKVENNKLQVYIDKAISTIGDVHTVIDLVSSPKNLDIMKIGMH